MAKIIRKLKTHLLFPCLITIIDLVHMRSISMIASSSFQLKGGTQMRDYHEFFLPPFSLPPWRHREGYGWWEKTKIEGEGLEIGFQNSKHTKRGKLLISLKSDKVDQITSGEAQVGVGIFEDGPFKLGNSREFFHVLHEKDF